MQNEKAKQFINSPRFVDIILISVAVIWGLGFPATQSAVDSGMGAGLIVMLRFAVAALIMLVLFFKEIKTLKPQELIPGIIAGVIVSSGFIFQTVGIKYTTPSNNAFLTSTNVIMVPFLSWVLLKQRPPKKLFAVAFACFVGTVMLTVDFSTGFNFALGDILTLCCAVLFSLHIVYLGTVADKISAQKLSFVQMVVSALVAFFYVMVAERAELSSANFAKGIPPILYLAIFSTAYAFLVQTYAQSRTSPTRISIIFSTEGLLGSAFSVLLGYEGLTLRMIVGGVIIFTSLILMELDLKKLFAKKELEKPL